MEGFLCLEEVELRGGWRCGEREGQGHRLLFFPPTQSITRKAKESDSPPPSFPTLPNSNPRLARVSSPPGPNPVLCCDCESKTREEMAPLSWRHHTLLQALLSRGPLPEPDFHSLFAQISGGKNPATHQQLFNDILLKINKELAYLQFELRACINQYDGMVYYGVVNNIADEESKLGSKYSVPQIAFYKGLLEAIAHEAGNDGSITNIEALNIRIENQVVIADGSQDSLSRLPTSITNFSLSQKEKTLNELIRDRWLSYTSTGKIGLGIRSFLDLRSWFRRNDIPSCVVCNEAGIKASTCPNEGCNVRIHEYCLKKKFSKQMASRACPYCGTEWPRLEGEDGGDEDVNEPGESQAPSTNRSSRKRKRRKGVKAELVEEDENTGPSTAVPRSCRNTKAEAVEVAQEASSAGASQPARGCKRRNK